MHALFAAGVCGHFPLNYSLSLIGSFTLLKAREGREKEARRQKVAKRLPQEPKEGADKVARLR